jgi:hypothetical protein
LKNLHCKSAITCIELSVYHNLIFTGSKGTCYIYLIINKESIMAYNYEFGRTVGGAVLPQGSEVTAL